MEEYIKENGWMVNNMVLELLLNVMENVKKGNGLMEGEQDGLNDYNNKLLIL